MNWRVRFGRRGRASEYHTFTYDPFGLSLSKPLPFIAAWQAVRPFDRLRANGSWLRDDALAIPDPPESLAEADSDGLARHMAAVAYQ
jgi:hypothetical protein